eukprot:TRINITY_DN23982_c0_g1_i1.p1 TRINITY_DN23982_c0_g1~~TRINITY_DN23982_c0_g1_i1.p1  ORF type:complete len:176 (-),score=32.75 TRINITY_DN23982_c0_g1_i1:122-649(-)
MINLGASTHLINNSEVIDPNANLRSYQMSLNNITLFGRVYPRALVDGNIQYLKDVRFVTTKSTKSSEGYLVIRVPFFTDSLLIDPDFTVLLDGARGEEENVIASSADLHSSLPPHSKKNANALTIGLVVGLVGGIFTIGIIVAVFIYVRREAFCLKAVPYEPKMEQSYPMRSLHH